MPRLARGNGYDLVIRHLAVGRVSFGGILEDSTYTFCQMSYDVGHDPSIVSQTEAFQASRNFIPYARYKTSFERRKSGLHTTPVPREKLYAIPPIAACGPEKKGPNPPRSAATEAPAGETQAGSEPTGSPSASRPAARHEAAAEGPISPPVPSAESQGRGTAEGARTARQPGEMAGGRGKGPRGRRAGRAAVDWTRSFITPPLNPPYDAFVRWQFHHLKDGDFVKIDKHPVIWCPKDQAPIGDHDRIEGEGEVPMEYTLLKFPLADGRFLVAATIRPETVSGQTNPWADPKAPYVVAMGGQERCTSNARATSQRPA